jgi:hypothetical protein
MKEVRKSNEKHVTVVDEKNSSANHPSVDSPRLMVQLLP